MENENVLLNGGESITDVCGKIRLIRNGHGLDWGTDAYYLAAYLRRRPSRRACELGSGTGVISLLAAACEKFAHVTAVEINHYSAELAERNVRLNGLRGKVTVLCADVRDVSCADVGGKCAAVFANPPYINHGGVPAADDARNAAKHEIFGGIADFCAAGARLLDHGGSFYCVFRPERLPDLFEAMRKNKLEPKRMREIVPYLGARPSAVLVEAKLGAAPRLDAEPPLVLHPARASTELFPEAKTINEYCDFYLPQVRH